MTTEVTISSKKPNHNPFRVRTIAVNQATFNQALDEAICRIVSDTGCTVHTHTSVLKEGESLPPHTCYIHDRMVIVIDEIRPE